MSDKKARFVGHPDGVDITVPIDGGREQHNLHIPYGGELPTEINGLKVPAAFRDSLLEQEANWTSVTRGAKTTKDGE